MVHTQLKSLSLLILMASPLAVTAAPATDSTSATAAPIPDETDRLSLLRQKLPHTHIEGPINTPVAGIHQVKLGDSYIYLSDDGRYAFMGDLIDIASGENNTELLRNADRRGLIKNFNSDYQLVYPAEGEEKAQITAFTDVSCPACKTLHSQVPALQKAGVSVHYIAFPRGSTRGPGYAELRSIWCAEDRIEAMNLSFDSKEGELDSGECKQAKGVDAGYALGERVGLNSTPTLILPDGTLMAGARRASTLLELLNVKP